jgi:hypothetical protein
MFDVSSRAKLSVSALAERKIASARPRKYGLLLRAEEEMLLYGQALASHTGFPSGPLTSSDEGTCVLSHHAMRRVIPIECDGLL